MRLLLVSLAMAWLTSAAAQIAPPDRWEADIAAFEAADRNQPPAPGGGVFIGSSSIRLWHTLQQDFPDTPIIQRGFGGSEIRDATRHAARIVLPYGPRLVVLYAGDNDLSQGRTPEQVRDDFVAFVERVRRGLPDVAIAFIAIKPSPARANLLDAARGANAPVEAYTKSRRAIRHADIFTPMLGGDGQPRRELFGADALHLNRAGYGLWITRIAPVLRELAPP
ncbi:MAG: SGNH/GDSL hydrolase family protein, partial [Dokdonella sp.]